ncbi:ribonuclease [Erythrobacter sp. JK5]|uniref:ribonuclease n=1 Tax=Erythrobacter sp. JK5 TaxID=2829500 RepID=UPI001BAA7F2A|nr:ribonuclease [Erythrobacter sp. JK5]QUL39262.1 ribonuclease [Erythrobacter sp. JK5]
MAEWLIEEGIGERRALLAEGDRVLAAKLCWPGELLAGTRHAARLISKPTGARRGIAALENGMEVLVDHLPADLTEGSAFELRVSRAVIAERGRFKQAQGRYVPAAEAKPSPDAVPFAPGATAKQFPAGWWEEIWHAASSGTMAFAGGEILCSVTPAMTVIDIDGDLPPRELAISAMPAVGQALRQFGIGGNIGIDFPTIQSRSERQTVDKALAEELRGWPHERTAMNGFGFVQLVAQLDGPSLLHRFASSRTGMCARHALRVAERAEGTGPILLLTVHPALKSRLKPEWLDELARRTGRQVRIETDPGLALEAPSAQILSA